LKNPGVAAWGGETGYYLRAGQETKFHQPACVITWEFDAVQNRRIAAPEVQQRFDTQLHLVKSMGQSETRVKQGIPTDTIFLRLRVAIRT
jgi:hypothetical protein